MPTQNQRQESETGRIVYFPARSPAGKPKLRQEPGQGDRQAPPVADLEQYERSAEPDDYPHRMMMNLAAFAFILVLTLAGIWLAEQLALLRKQQDCAFAGRKNCPEVETQVRSR